MNEEGPDHYYDCLEVDGDAMNGDKEHEHFTEIENKAKRLRRAKDFGFDKREKTLTLVRREHHKNKKTREAWGEGAETVILGAYTYGGLQGITNLSSRLVEVARYLNAAMKHHGGHGSWSSLCLNYNTKSHLHRDSHNLNHTLNTTVAFGNFAGGRLWVEDGEEGPGGGSEPRPLQLETGQELQGAYYDTKENPVKFEPRLRHDVEDWEGVRCSMTAYTTRGLTKMSRWERDVLRSMSFPVGRLRAGDPPAVEGEYRARPKKGVRKRLWKSAAQISVLLAATLSVASSYLAEAMPRSNGPAQATLFEIGSVGHTLKAADSGNYVLEPMAWNDFLQDDGPKRAMEMITRLRPRVVWMNTSRGWEGVGKEILDVLDSQVALGGSFVLEEKADEKLRETPEMNEILANFHTEETNEDGTIMMKIKEKETREDTSREPCLEGEDVHQEGYVMDVVRRGGQSSGVGGGGITYDPSVPEHVRSALSRLQQNLGHPRVEDLVRHLRLAGAETSIVKAAKSLKCQACARCKNTSSTRPSSMPSLLDFNQLVSVDVFHMFDSKNVRHEFLSVVDHGTTYHLVGKLQGHSAEAFEKQFVQLWANTFGAPGTISADLETGRTEQFRGVPWLQSSAPPRGKPTGNKGLSKDMAPG